MVDCTVQPEGVAVAMEVYLQYVRLFSGPVYCTRGDKLQGYQCLKYDPSYLDQP